MGGWVGTDRQALLGLPQRGQARGQGVLFRSVRFACLPVSPSGLFVHRCDSPARISALPALQDCKTAGRLLQPPAASCTSSSLDATLCAQPL